MFLPRYSRMRGFGVRPALLMLSIAIAIGAGSGVGFPTLLPAAQAARQNEAPLGTPGQALERLLAGNRRYVEGRSANPHRSAQRRTEVARGQHPFAVVLACADSRTAPEIVFDAGLGDLFVVRVSGNISDDAVIGSLEYAVEHLGTPLVVVLGHSQCGAVQAAVQAAASGGHVPRHLDTLVNAIRPAVVQVRRSGSKGSLLDRAIDRNARMVAHDLRASTPVLAKYVKEGELNIVAARYNLNSGEVKLLDSAPALGPKRRTGH